MGDNRLPRDIIESYTPEDVGWNAGYPENYNCRMRRDFEAWSFIERQRESLNLQKVWFFLTRITSERLAEIRRAMYNDSDKHTLFAKALFENYRNYAETIQ